MIHARSLNILIVAWASSINECMFGKIMNCFSLSRSSMVDILTLLQRVQTGFQYLLDGTSEVMFVYFNKGAELSITKMNLEKEEE